MDAKQLQQENVLLGMLIERNVAILKLHQENTQLRQNQRPAPVPAQDEVASDG